MFIFGPQGRQRIPILNISLLEGDDLAIGLALLQYNTDAMQSCHSCTARRDKKFTWDQNVMPEKQSGSQPTRNVNSCKPIHYGRGDSTISSTPGSTHCVLGRPQRSLWLNQQTAIMAQATLDWTIMAYIRLDWDHIRYKIPTYRMIGVFKFPISQEALQGNPPLPTPCDLYISDVGKHLTDLHGIKLHGIESSIFRHS